MSALPDLRADCSGCAALCCVVPTFEKGPDFACDKPAGQPCRHLARTGKCGIHDSRMERGYRGCVVFDCLGAGQRATAILGGAASGPERDRMYSGLLRVHRLLELLDQAGRLALDPALEKRRRVLLGDVTCDDAAIPGWLEVADLSAIEARVQDFLRQLRPLVTLPAT